MMDKLMSMVKDQVLDAVGGMSDIPEDKKAATIDATTSSLMDGLKKYATPNNLSAFTSMLGIGGGDSGAAKEMLGGLESSVVSSLTSKVGLNSSMAQKIATTVIPLVMSLLKGKVDDDNEPGFNIGSIIGGLTGSGSGGGIMNMLGGLLGSK